MNPDRINNYEDFCRVLRNAGFSMGGSSDGIYSVVQFGWEQEPPYETKVRWHTGDADTDPWEWRMRVLDDCDDIAYGKLFFNKSGYITKEWYPYFLAARRSGRSFREAYEDGLISHYAKRIYDAVSQNHALPLHVIKETAGFKKEDKSKFDRALTELQMKLYLTMCGRSSKISRLGEEYGWSATMFCTVESFWDKEVFDAAAELTKDEAVDQITKQILTLNPDADDKKVKKFIVV